MTKRNRAYKRKEMNRLRAVEEEYRKVKYYCHDWYKDRQLLAEYREFIANPTVVYSIKDCYDTEEYRFDLLSPERTMHVNCIKRIDKDLKYRLGDVMFDDAKRYFAEFLAERVRFVPKDSEVKYV